MNLTHENYFSSDMSKKYMSNSLYKNFVGSLGLVACESRALAYMRGEFWEPPSKAMLVGSYVDAHFSGTLPMFIEKNDCHTQKGKLRAEYIQAEEMISKCEKDEYFTMTMSGEKQVIMTAEMFGMNWKIMIDSYHAGRCITDLKTCGSINKACWVKDLHEYVSFVEFYGYIEQLSIYQKVVEINTGNKLPCLISAVSKEDEPNIEVIGVGQDKLDEALFDIESNMPRIINLIKGEDEPQRCGKCKYCRQTKKLTGAINYNDIIFSF